MHRYVFALCALLGFICSFADATEAAFPLYLNGYAGPKAGYMPPPGMYIRNDIYHHPGSVSQSFLGNRVTAKVKAKISLDVLGLTYISPWKFLGADIGFSTLIPVGRINVHAKVTETVPKVVIRRNSRGFRVPTLTFETRTKSKHQVAHGLADILVVPLMLGWHAEQYNLHIMAFQGLFVPTGSFSKRKIANMGQNHFATETDAGFTWLNEKTGTEVSAMTGVTVNFTNHKNHYRSGSGWHTDFFAGQYLTPKLQVGLSGYWFYQLTPDKGNGAKILNGFRSHVLGLGPSISYEFKVFDLPVIANIRYFKESNSKNYLKGETFYFTLSIPIP